MCIQISYHLLAYWAFTQTDTDNCVQWQYWHVLYLKQRKVDVACVWIILEQNIALVFRISVDSILLKLSKHRFDAAQYLLNSYISLNWTVFVFVIYQLKREKNGCMCAGSCIYTNFEMTCFTCWCTTNGSLSIFSSLSQGSKILHLILWLLALSSDMIILFHQATRLLSLLKPKECMAAVSIKNKSYKTKVFINTFPMQVMSFRFIH